MSASADNQTLIIPDVTKNESTNYLIMFNV